MGQIHILPKPRNGDEPLHAAGKLDLSGKNILVLGRGCHGPCAVLAREGAQAHIYSGYLPKDAAKVFLKKLNEPIDLTTIRLIERVADPSGYRGIRDVWLEEGETRPIDYIIIDDLTADFVPAILKWYGDKKPPQSALMSDLLFAPVPDATAFDLGAVTPDIFLPYHRGRHQTVPFNPMVTGFDAINSAWQFDEELAKLLCVGATGEAMKDCVRDL